MRVHAPVRILIFRYGNFFRYLNLKMGEDVIEIAKVKNIFTRLIVIPVMEGSKVFFASSRAWPESTQ